MKELLVPRELLPTVPMNFNGCILMAGMSKMYGVTSYFFEVYVYTRFPHMETDYDLTTIYQSEYKD
jgi:hypothetical protein